MRLSMVLIALSLFLLAIILPSSAQNVKDKGLILYFSFDKENGGKIKDQTDGGNDGDLNKGKINTKEKVHGKGALEMKDPQSSLEVESFKELEDYQDNSYLFWLYFIEGTNGAWSQIIAKKAPGSDRSPGIWICPDTLNIHWRFNPGNKGCDRCGPDGEGSLFKLKKWYHVAGVKKTGQTLSTMLMVKRLPRKLVCRKITHKEQRSCILVEPDTGLPPSL